MALALDDHERSMLAGDHGEGAALAARLVVRAAEVLGAERLIPITRAHVDSCLYHGEATIDFVRRLVDVGAEEIEPLTGAAFGAYMRAEARRWRELAAAAGMQE